MFRLTHIPAIILILLSVTLCGSDFTPDWNKVKPIVKGNSTVWFMDGQKDVQVSSGSKDINVLKIHTENDALIIDTTDFHKIHSQADVKVYFLGIPAGGLKSGKKLKISITLSGDAKCYLGFSGADQNNKTFFPPAKLISLVNTSQEYFSEVAIPNELKSLTALLVIKKAGVYKIGKGNFELLEDDDSVKAISVMECLELHGGIAAIFKSGEKITLKAKTKAAGLKYRLLNWKLNEVAHGLIPDDGEITFSGLDCGYYHVLLNAPGYKFTDSRPFAIIPPITGKRQKKTQYSWDLAASMIQSVYDYPGGYKKGIDLGIELCKLSGANFIRERIAWSETEPERGRFIWNPSSRQSQSVFEKYKSAGINLLVNYGRAPKWAKNDGEKYPTDLKDTYNYARSAAAVYKNSVTAWEFFNEVDAYVQSSSWEHASQFKAASLGFKAGNPESIVISTSSLYPAESFGAQLLRHDIPMYIDALNFHIYDSLGNFQKRVKVFRDSLPKEVRQDMPVWITETGIWVEGLGLRTVNGKKNLEHSLSQEMFQAEHTVKSHILLQAAGVDRSFTFTVMPYYEQAGKKVWGMLREDYTAKPALAAFATLNDQLGGAEYLGELRVGNNIRAFLYKNNNGTQTAVVWSNAEDERGECLPRIPGFALPADMRENSIVLKSGGDVLITDIMGGKTVCKVANSEIKIKTNRFPQYISNLTGITADIPVAKKKSLPTFDDFDKSVVLRVCPSEGFTPSSDGKTMSVNKSGKDLLLNLQIYNFSGNAKKCSVHEKNKMLDFPEEIVLAPFDCKTVQGKLNWSEINPIGILEIAGISSGKKITSIEIPFLASEKVDKNMISANGMGNAAKWRKNSSGNMEILNDSGTIVFKSTFSKDNGWSYPEYVLDLPAESLVSKRYLSFDLKTLFKNNDFSLAYIMFCDSDTPEHGRAIYSSLRINHDQWAENVIDLSSLDLKNIKQIRIGFSFKNSKGKEMTYMLKNFKTIKTCDNEK